MNRGYVKLWRPDEGSYWRGFTLEQRSVWIELLMWADHRTGTATIGKRQLARQARVSVTCAYESVKHFQELGLLRKLPRNGDLPGDPSSDLSGDPRRTTFKFLKWDEEQGPAIIPGDRSCDREGDREGDHEQALTKQTLTNKETTAAPKKKKKAPEGEQLGLDPNLLSQHGVNSDPRRFLHGALPEAIGWLGREVSDVDRAVAVRKLKAGESVPNIVARAYCGIAFLGAPSVAVALSKAWDGKFGMLTREMAGVAESVKRNAAKRDQSGNGSGSGDGGASLPAPPPNRFPHVADDSEARARAVLDTRGASGLVQIDGLLDLAREPRSPGQEVLHGVPGNAPPGPSDDDYGPI